MRMYQRTDRFLKSLVTRIRREINHLSVMAFDELNVIRVRKETSGMFSRLMEFCAKEYAEICKAARRYALAQLIADERKKVREKDFDPVEFVETMVLRKYDPVTQYLYYPEADRKRLRLAEGINANREYQNRPGYSTLLKRNAKLLKDQFGQYAINIEDKTVVETWKAAGIEKVQWITQDDEKVCAECRPRHLQIYDIHRVPDKHYNCRCYLRPMR